MKKRILATVLTIVMVACMVPFAATTVAAADHTHELGYESITREPTCTANGEKSLFCAICDAAYATEQIEKKGHGESVAVISVQPTCTADGEEKIYCKDCGMLVGTSIITATGHDDGVWQIDFEATADHSGQMTKYCSLCDAALESKTLKLHEHSYSSWRTNNDGTHSRDCYQCGFTESANCNYVAAEADSTDDHKKCDTCDHTLNTEPEASQMPEDEGLPIGTVIAIVAVAVIIILGGEFAICWFVIKKKKN